MINKNLAKMKYNKSIYSLLGAALLISWTNRNGTSAVGIANRIAVLAASEVNIADMRVVEGNEGKKKC
jgi:hypothetical protein